MRQVSVLFINMDLPIKGNSHSWALQRAFEVIHECARRLRGEYIIMTISIFLKHKLFLKTFSLAEEIKS